MTRRWLYACCTLAGVVWTVGWQLATQPAWASQASAAVHSPAAQVFFLPEAAGDVVRIVENIAVASPPAGGTLRVWLPAGYSNLQVMDHPYHVGSGGILEVGGWGSGSGSVVFSFDLAFRGQMGLQWPYHAPFAIDEMQLYVPVNASLAVSAPQLLTSTQVVNVAGKSFRVLTRLGVPAGDDWSIRIQRLPPATPASSGADGLPLLGASLGESRQAEQALGNLVLALFVLGVGLAGIERAAHRTGGGTNRTEALLQAWVALELAYREHRVDSTQYARRRAYFKEQLMGRSERTGGG